MEQSKEKDDKKTHLAFQTLLEVRLQAIYLAVDVLQDVSFQVLRSDPAGFPDSHDRDYPGLYQLINKAA